MFNLKNKLATAVALAAVMPQRAVMGAHLNKICNLEDVLASSMLHQSNCNHSLYNRGHTGVAAQRRQAKKLRAVKRARRLGHAA